MTNPVRTATRGGGGWAAALLLLLLPGCMFIHGSIRQEDALDPEKVKAVTAGKTRRAELLALLGPPEAIVRKGEGAPAALPPPPGAPLHSPARLAADPGLGEGGGAWSERQGFLALFADRPLTERHGVYYYSSTRLVYSGGFFLFAAEDSRRIVRDRLWVLVDDATGLVEAVVWRPGEAPPAAAPRGPEP